MKLLKTAACMLSTALLAMGLPLPAAAAQPFTYTVLEDGTAEVTCADTSLITVEIPSEIDGYTVTSLAEECFSGCTSLEEVTIPDTVNFLNDYAFHGCQLLETITIPANVTGIGSFVFEGCTSLAEILVSEENTTYCSDEGVLYTADMNLLVRYPAAKPSTEYQIPRACSTIAPWAFTDCCYLQELTMTDVLAIGADAFFCASSLEEVTISEGVTELIGPSFAYCTALRHVELPSSLESIGEKCFYGCVSLQGVDLPDGLLTIGEMAFYGCLQIKEMSVPSSVKSIGEMGIGYSVDPDTNENTVIEGFEIKTVSGSKAVNYAKRNDIAYSATVDRTTAIIVIFIIAVLIILGIACYIVYANRKKQEAALAAAAAAAAAEKRERRKERKKRKK